MNNGRLVFLHIPKTGGTTLKQILLRFFPLEDIIHFNCFIPEVYSFDDAVLANFRLKKLIMGHFPLSFEIDNTPDTKFITLLRNPLKRSLSWYCASLVSQGLKVDPTNMVWKPELWPDNLQTRLLCNKMEGALYETDLRKAKRNLEKFFFVGLTEKFDEFILILKRLLNFEEVYYGAKKNVTKASLSLEEFPKRFLKRVESINEADIELYNFALRLYNEKKENNGASAEVGRFREDNQGPYGLLASDYTELLNYIRQERVFFIFRLAKAFADGKEREKAFVFLKKAVFLSWGIRVNDPFFLYNEASVLESLGILDRAERIFKVVVEHPWRIKVLKGGGYYHLACIALYREEKELAREYLKRCLSFEPNHEMAKRILLNLA